jgi:hypothetical protein
MKHTIGVSTQRYSVVVALSALLMSGCGGGGGGGSSSSSLFGGSSATTVSAVQQSYESVALAGNGGLHSLEGSLSFSTSSTGAVSLSPSSYFYSDNSSIAQSPTNGAQPLTVSFTSVASTLPMPALNGADRYVINGTVYVRAFPSQAQVSYSGANVQESYFATDGKTVVESLLGISYTVVPLSGLLLNAPAELVNDSNFGLLTDTINGQSLYNQQASWQTGAAYVKATRQVVGDMLGTGDCVAPATTGANITPCSATISTLEAFFPFSADGTTYQLAGGQIVSLAGVRAWVSNTSLSTTTPEYRVFYQNNGAIYAGYLIRNGTVLQFEPFAGGTTQSFNIFLNNAALQSLKSAINF